jgi:hypothetical protein
MPNILDGKNRMLSTLAGEKSLSGIFIAVLSAFFLFPVPADSACSTCTPKLEWKISENSAANSDEVAYGVAFDPSGNFIVGGTAIRTDLAQKADWQVVKYDAAGALSWARDYNSPDSLDDVVRGVAVDSSGNIFAAGYETRAGEGRNLMLRKYASDGSVLWTRTWGGASLGDDMAYGVGVDGSSNVVVAGSTFETNEGLKWLVLKYDPAGEVLWTYTCTYDSKAENDEALAVAVDAVSGSIFVDGYESTSAADRRWRFKKLSATGSLIWQQFITGTNNEFSYARGVAVDNHGDMLVAGTVDDSATDSTFRVQKWVEGAGTPSWSDSYTPFARNDSALAVSLNSVGEVFAVGRQTVSAGNSEWLVRRFDHTEGAATACWTFSCSGDLTDPDNAAYGTAVDSGGRVVVVGGEEVTGEGSNWTVRMLSMKCLSGSVSVTRTMGGTGRDFIVCLTLTNNGDETIYGAGMTTTYFAVSGAGGLQYNDGPYPAMPVTLTRNASITFTWTLSGNVPGTASINCTLTATGAVALNTPAAVPYDVLVPATLDASMSYSQASVCSGKSFILILTVTNTGNIRADSVAPGDVLQNPGVKVFVPSNPFPATPVSINGGATAVFTWTAQGTAVGTVAFMTTVTGTDSESAATPVKITDFTPGFIVNAPGVLEASASFPSTVSVGQDFLLTFTLTNSGASEVTGVTPRMGRIPSFGGVGVLSGPFPPSSSINPGNSFTFTWTLTGTDPRTVNFSLTADGSSCGGGSSVTDSVHKSIVVQSAAALESSVAMIPGKANIGQPFLVTVTVTNTGQAKALGVMVENPLGWGGGTATMTGPSPAVPYAQLNGGSSVTFTWNMTGVAAGPVMWGSTATGTDANSGEPVSSSHALSPAGGAVQTPASLSARAVAYVSPLCLNSETLVTLTITNTGQAQANSVTAEDLMSGGAGELVMVSSPAFPLTLAGGASATVSWTYRGNKIGLADLTTTVTGTDQNTGLPLADVRAVTGSVTVVNEGKLEVSGAVAQKVSTGQTFTVTMTVTNTGGATVNAVTPGVIAGPGATQVVRLTLASPATATLLAGESATFTWSYFANTESPDPVGLTVSASGSTCGGGVTAKEKITVWTKVDRAIELPSFVRMSPGTVSQGQNFTVSVTVTNTGEARANNVSVEVPRCWGAGSASVFSGPVPAMPLAQLNAGAAVTFTWTMTAMSPGGIGWSSTASGTDANSGSLVSETSVCSSTLYSVQLPAALSAAAAAYVSPLCSGANTLVTMTVSNTGGAPAMGVTAPAVYVRGGTGLTLVSGPTPSFPQPIPAAGHLTFTWTFGGGTTGVTNLSTTFTGTDGNGGWAVTSGPVATANVTVVSPGSLVSSATIPAHVSTGQVFQVSFTVTNTGGAPVTSLAPAMLAGSGGVSVSLLSGPGSAAGINPGSSTTFIWTYRGAASGVPYFTMSAQGTTCTNNTVLAIQSAVSNTVETAAHLVESLAMYPGTVTVGQQFLVTATITNTGQAAANSVSAGPPVAWAGGNGTVSAGPYPAMPVAMAGGSSLTFTWTLTASVAGPVRWCATATGTDINSLTVTSTGAVSSPAGTTVLSPAALAATVVRSPSTLCSGRDFLVTLTVTNTGQTQANGVSAAGLLVDGTGSVLAVSGPTPAMPVTLPGGGSQTFTYTYTGDMLGTVYFMTTVTGTDANLGSGVSRITAFTPAATVTSPGAFDVSGVMPARMSTNQVFQVTLTVTNSGGAQITGMVPSLAVGPGAGLVTAVSGPVPATTFVNAGSMVSYTWTYKALSGGLVAFTASVSGQTCAGSSPLQASATVSSTISIEAMLYSSVRMLRTNANVGQNFMVTVTVTNTGQSAASGMDINVPSICTAGGAVPVSGPNPALPVSLAGAASRTFTWTFTGSVAGTAEFTATATGTDAFAGTPVTSGPVADSRPHLIQAPAFLDAFLAVSTTSAVTGEKFLVTLTVTNTGDATARMDRPVLRGDGGGGFTLTSLPGTFPRSITGGTTIVFTWTATPGMEGPIQFSTTAVGVDVNQLNTLSAPAAHSTPFVVIGIPVIQVASFTSSRESLDPGDSLVLRLAIRSTGTTSATVLVPSVPAVSGDGKLTLVSGPTPASVTQLAPGSTAVFSWVYRAVSVGTVRISAGADADNTAAVTAAPLVVYVARSGGVPKNVVVDPNPLHTRNGGQVRFINLPSFSGVRLFTISGEPVRTITADIFGVAVWNGRNTDGTVVAPGVYLFAVESPGTARYVGKILVVQ